VTCPTGGYIISGGYLLPNDDSFWSIANYPSANNQWTVSINSQVDEPESAVVYYLCTL
jgi:hypothetical protein